MLSPSLFLSSGVDASGCVVTGYSTIVGTHALTATAKDKAGNLTTKTLATYTVLPRKIAGFFDLVDMSGIVNTIKGGQSVPLKFQVFAGTVQKTDPVSGGMTIKLFTREKLIAAR